ncbi:four helix bundle protein [Pontibacter ruber]|uniref:Four helix bundle protein n=1 Tax=Pontibacter ruber TaxID=1343895 RepID=A0ABW5CXF4_9BACT|nr:four helix bundle protein [Pontibacter ruber]
MTSVAANYRAACRARSSAEFHSKISIVIEEADESLFWVELLEESGTSTSASVLNLKKEATEILSVLAKARKNTPK